MLINGEFEKNKIELFKMKKIILICFLLISLFFSFKGSLFSKNWQQVSMDGEILLSPIVNKNRIFVINNLGQIYKVNKKNGKILWSVQLPERDPIGISLYRNNLFVVTSSGKLFCVSSKRGEALWSFFVNTEINLSTYFHIYRNKLYINTDRATVYAIDVKDGELKWQFKNKMLDEFHKTNDERYLGKLEIYKGNLIFTDKNYIFSLDLSSGKKNWFQDLEKPITAMQVQMNKLYLAQEGKIYSLSLNDGSILKELEEDILDVICFRDISFYESFSLKNFYQIFKSHTRKPLLIVSADGRLISVDLDLKKTDKIFDFGEEIKSCPQIIKGDAFLFAQNDYLFNIYNSDFQQQKTETGSSFEPIFFEHKSLSFPFLLKNKFVLKGNEEGGIFLESIDGKKIWQYVEMGEIKSRPVIKDNFVYFTSTDGRLSRILLTKGTIPLSKLASKFSLEQREFQLGTNKVQEFTIFFKKLTIPNPWNQVQVQAVFSHEESGREVKINGFYYDERTWKLRFNPPLKGTWKWTITVSFNDLKTYQRSGEFYSDTDTKESFIRINDEYSPKFTLNGKTEFFPIGFQNEIKDYNKNGNEFDDWFLDKTDDFNSGTVNTNKFLETYGNYGDIFNLFRFGVDNVSFALFDDLYLGAYPLLDNAKKVDYLFQSLRDNSLHIWLSLFSFHMNELETKKEKDFFDKYVEYIVARYGIYVDIWEIGNEVHCSDDLIQYYSNLIKSLDYEDRIVTSNWEKPYLNELDIISLHHYESDPSWLADLNLIKLAEESKINSENKLVVFSEMGNLDSSFDIDSSNRLRIRSWTGFFKKISIIYWNTSHSKDYYNTFTLNGNVFIGETERAEIAVLNQFTRNIPLDSVRKEIITGNPNFRVYLIENDEKALGYFVNSSNIDHLFFANPFKGDILIEWIDPKSGAIISREEIKASDKRIYLPPFKIDIAMRVFYIQ